MPVEEIHVATLYQVLARFLEICGASISNLARGRVLLVRVQKRNAPTCSSV